MLPVTKHVIFPDVDDVERIIHYRVHYETHPEYKDIPVKHLKKMFDFEAGDTVPDIAIIQIIEPEQEIEFDRNGLEEEIMENEGITDRKDIVFE